MSKLETHVQQFAHLKRASGAVWTDATKYKAPHKPFLLMSVLDMAHCGKIATADIDVDNHLDELCRLFERYWRCIFPVGKIGSIGFPFSRLHNESEPFWELLPRPGYTISRALIDSISTTIQLKQYVRGAKIDRDLFKIIQNTQGREVLRTTLLQSYFSPEVQATLREQSQVNCKISNTGKDMEDSLITIDHYKTALVKADLSDSQLAMLKAHYHAPDRRVTMTRLAEAVGYQNYSAANLHYGKLAKKLCEVIGSKPDERYKDGSPFWLSAIAEVWKNAAGEYEFQMWAELAEALEELKMV